MTGIRFKEGAPLWEMVIMLTFCNLLVVPVASFGVAI